MKRLFLLTSVLCTIFMLATAAQASTLTITGKLQRTVEPGGWVIAGKDKYLLLNFKKFENLNWFKESTSVEAVGDIKDVMTTFMEGTPFEATSMHPIEQGATRSAEEKRFTRILVTGDSIVHAQPDTATIVFSVVTQAKQAIEAQQQNATKSDALIRALKTVASGSEIKTSGYSLQPQRVYKEGQPPTITGYEARNSVTVVMSDLTKIGAVIDASGQAGANEVSGVSFSLRQDRPAKDSALREATREALSKAQVIAQALGGRVVRIVEVQEEGFQQRPPQPVYQAEAFMTKRYGATTPVEVGTLDISYRVQLIAEVETGS